MASRPYWWNSATSSQFTYPPMPQQNFTYSATLGNSNWPLVVRSDSNRTDWKYACGHVVAVQSWVNPALNCPTCAKPGDHLGANMAAQLAAKQQAALAAQQAVDDQTLMAMAKERMKHLQEGMLGRAARAQTAREWLDEQVGSVCRLAFA